MIVRLGDTPVDAPEELKSALAALDENSGLLLIHRDGGQLFVGVPLA